MFNPYLHLQPLSTGLQPLYGPIRSTPNWLQPAGLAFGLQVKPSVVGNYLPPPMPQPQFHIDSLWSNPLYKKIPVRVVYAEESCCNQPLALSLGSRTDPPVVQADSDAIPATTNSGSTRILEQSTDRKNREDIQAKRPIGRSPGKDDLSRRHQTYYKNNRDAILKRADAYRKAHKDSIQISQKKYREKNRESLRAAGRDYYKKNRESIVVKRKEMYARKREILRAKAKAYREKRKNFIRAEIAKNKDEMRGKRMAYYEKNKEAILSKQREYYTENRATILTKHREYYLQNRDELLAKQKQYYLENRDAILKRCDIYRKNRKNRKNLSDERWQSCRPNENVNVIGKEKPSPVEQLVRQNPDGSKGLA